MTEMISRHIPRPGYDDARVRGRVGLILDGPDRLRDMV